MKYQNFETLLMTERINRTTIILRIIGWFLFGVFSLIGIKGWNDTNWVGNIVIYPIIGIAFIIFFYFLGLFLQIIGGINEKLLSKDKQI